MNINDVIARNVRAARERKKLTLDGAAELTAGQAAQAAGTITNELLSRLGSRLGIVVR